ncbi:hypothetical protein LSAT2_023525 [Lamellibrachia satsuma]|nr:hypothetical protein LSAT2_023525 [Lamellibrachia satsuma]
MDSGNSVRRCTILLLSPKPGKRGNPHVWCRKQLYGSKLPSPVRADNETRCNPRRCRAPSRPRRCRATRQLGDREKQVPGKPLTPRHFPRTSGCVTCVMRRLIDLSVGRPVANPSPIVGVRRPLTFQWPRVPAGIIYANFGRLSVPRTSDGEGS